MEQSKIDKTIASLTKNNFEVFVAKDAEHAHKIFFDTIVPSLNIKSYAMGDSLTMRATGVLDALQENKELTFIKTFGEGWSFEEKYEARRQALLADLFITGTNAVTEDGELVNLDMYGNRINGINFGPHYVVLFIGINKITSNLDEAMNRVRSIAAPKNGMRHAGLKTPCNKLGKCMNCSSADRICNEWSIIAKCFPAKRIKIILIEKELGL